jgi:hypothetical protein
MIRFASILVVILATSLPFVVDADEKINSPTERSSAFVEGEVDPSEAFGPIEGPVFLILGLVGIASVFVLLILSNRAQNSTREEMKKRLNGILPLLLLLISLPLLAAVQDDPTAKETPTASDGDFVPVDLSKKPSINGKAHAIAAYAIVIGFLVLYSYFLLHREKKVKKDLEHLKEQFPKDLKN